MRILAIDDNVTDQYLLREAALTHGAAVELSCAMSGGVTRWPS